MDRISSALLLLVAIPACSDSNTALSDLPAAAADAVCTYQARCGQMPDVATCKAATQTDTAQLSADVASGKTKYDGKAAAACLDMFRSESCNLSVQGGQPEPQACKDAFKGTVVAGGVCYADTECASGDCSGTVCSGSSTCCPGVCRASASASTIPVGGDCSGSGATCVSDAFCSYGLTTTCQAKTAMGQACDVSLPAESCVGGAYCMADGPTTGTCGKLPTEGQTCQPTGIGYVLACDSLLDYCDSVSLKCVPKIAIGGDCSTGATCVAYATCDSTGQCVSRPRAGESCDDFNGPHCLGSLECTSGTAGGGSLCALPPATTVCQ